MSSSERHSPMDVPGTYCASDFQGEDGGERIQKAIDAASTDLEHAVVTVGPDGPDENDVWLLSETIVLPSDTTLVLVGSTLRLAAGVGDNVLRNEHATSGDDTRDSDIHVLGFGDARIDGNASEQFGEVVPWDEGVGQRDDTVEGSEDYDYFRRNGIDLYKVDRFSLRGFTIGPTNAYAISPENVSYGYISNVSFRQDATSVNQDAINLGGPARYIQFVDLRGQVSDGAITIASRGTAASHKSNRETGDVQHVQIQNATFEGVGGREDRGGHMGLIHTWPAQDTVLEHLSVRNVAARELRNPAFRTGGAELSHLESFTSPECHRNIVLDGVYADGDALCELRCDISDLTIRNAYLQGNHRLFDQRGYEVRGLTLENCVQVPYTSVERTRNIPERQSSITFDGPLSRASVDRCKVDLANDGLHRGLVIAEGANITELTVEDFGVTNAEVGIATHEDADFERVTIEDCRFEGVVTEFELDREAGLVRNGIGREQSATGTPTECIWHRGDIVEVRDADTGSPNVVYLILGDSNYVRLGESR